MWVILLLCASVGAFSPSSQKTLLETTAQDPTTEALIAHLSAYTTPEGQLAAAIELLNEDIQQAAVQFNNETNFLLQELEKTVELIGNAVVAVLNDEIFEREFELGGLRDEIQEVKLQLNDATGTCAQYPSCVACAQDQACIWCTLLGRCVTGDKYGALNNECQQFSYRECPKLQCEEYETCTQCLTEADCAWCEGSGACSQAASAVCDPDFLFTEAGGGACPVTDAQMQASYRTDSLINVPDTRINELQSQLLALESSAALLRDQISQLEAAQAQIIASQSAAQSLVLSGDYTYADLQGLASSVEILAMAERNEQESAMNEVMALTANIVSEDIIAYVKAENEKRLAEVQSQAEAILQVQKETLDTPSPAF